MNQIIFKLCSQLRLIVVQRLLPSIDEGVRVPVREWLAFDDEFRAKLLRTNSGMESVALIGQKVRQLKQSLADQAQIAFDKKLISNQVLQSILKTNYQ